MKTKNKKSSALLILAAGCLWGFMGLLVRSLNTVGLGAMEICFFRGLVACICMLIGLLVFDRSALRIKLKDIWCFVGTGAFSLAFFNFCYFKTMTYTSLSVAAVLLYTAPAFVMLMSAILFRERFSLHKLAALVMAFLGCMFVSGITGGAGDLSLAGIMYGLGAGFGYALYSIFGRYAIEKEYSSLTISFYTFLFCTVVSVFAVDPVRVISTVGSSVQLSIQSVILVIIVTLLPYLSYTKGLQGLENGTASVLASVEPVVATLVGVIIYKEELDVWNVIGIALVLCSVAILNRKNQDIVGIQQINHKTTKK